MECKTRETLGIRSVCDCGSNDQDVDTQTSCITGICNPKMSESRTALVLSYSSSGVS